MRVKQLSLVNKIKEQTKAPQTKTKEVLITILVSRIREGTLTNLKNNKNQMTYLEC